MEIPANRNRSTKKWAIPLVVLLALQTSCGTTDLKPFSDATTEMAALVRSGFEKTHEAMKSAAASEGEPAGDGKCDPKDTSFRCLSKKLGDAWEPTEKAISSLVDYSDSLAALAASGDKGKQTAGKVVDSVKGLADAMGAFPGESAAVAVAKEVLGQVIQMKAERDIRKAVSQATAAVDRLAPLLSQNFRDLGVTHDAAAKVWEGNVSLKSKTLREYYEGLLDEERIHQKSLSWIHRYQVAKKPEVKADALAELKAADATFAGMGLSAGEAAAVETRRQQLMALATAQGKEISALEARYNQAVAELDHVRETRQRGNSVLAKGAEAIDAWQKAHKSLRADAEKKELVAGFSGILPHVGLRTATGDKHATPAIAGLTAINKEMSASAK
jgi:hypothetical protein